MECADAFADPITAVIAPAASSSSINLACRSLRPHLRTGRDPCRYSLRVRRPGLERVRGHVDVVRKSVFGASSRGGGPCRRCRLTIELPMKPGGNRSYRSWPSLPCWLISRPKVTIRSASITPSAAAAGGRTFARLGRGCARLQREAAAGALRLEDRSNKAETDATIRNSEVNPSANTDPGPGEGDPPGPGWAAHSSQRCRSQATTCPKRDLRKDSCCVTDPVPLRGSGFRALGRGGACDFVGVQVSSIPLMPAAALRSPADLNIVKVQIEERRGTVLTVGVTRSIRGRSRSDRRRPVTRAPSTFRGAAGNA